MNTFFYPRSIVVIGVSINKLSLGKIILLNNHQRGFEGKLYGVGSEQGDVSGIPVYDSLESVPEVPDVAIIITPASTVAGFMEGCGRKGIKRVVIETGGFSEFSGDKQDLEQEVLAIARKYGIRIVGPNCVGVGTAETGMMNAFGFFPREEGVSDFSVISQSGGIGNTFIRILNDNHLFWSKFASVGNKLDLDEVDFLEYFLQDRMTGRIMMYLEGFKRGRDFFNVSLKSEKPLIILKSNRSVESSKIARSHTTALSAGDDVVDAMFKQCAVTRVEGEDDLTVAAKAFKLPVVRGNNVAVLSRSGGHAVITADACAKYNLKMVEFPASYIKNLKQIYNTRVIAHQNPLDLGEIFDYTIFIRIVEETLKLEEIDGIIFNHLYQPSYEAESSRAFLKAVKDLVERYQKPVYVSITTKAEEYIDITKNHPYPTFSAPLQAALAYHMSLMYFKNKKTRDTRGEPERYAINFNGVEKIRKRCVDEKRNPLTDEALVICSAAGIVPVRYMTIKKPDEMKNCDVAYPVAIKLLSRDASHKTDVGGVRLNIGSAGEGMTAINTMLSSLTKSVPGLTADGFLVQEMSAPGEEFFVGARRDPVFGPVVMAGYGGIFIELINDRAMRLAPVTESEAMDMLMELKMFPLFQGVRGSTPLDTVSMVKVICRVSSLICAAEFIDEIDLNPVIVHRDGKGLSIVDSRIYLR